METFVIFFGIIVGLVVITKRGGRQSEETPPPRVSSHPPHPRKPSAAAPFKTATAKTAKSKVSGPARIIDGDTIVIKKTQIRLFGIDAPELEHPYGQKAKWAMVRLCKGQEITAEILEADHFGRTVAKCYLPDGRDLSLELVKMGLAIDWPKFSGGIYSSAEVPGVRKKLWLADARQKGRMHVWESFERRQNARETSS